MISVYPFHQGLVSHNFRISSERITHVLPPTRSTEIINFSSDAILKDQYFIMIEIRELASGVT